jgi:molybdopterin-binding protein
MGIRQLCCRPALVVQRRRLLTVYSPIHNAVNRWASVCSAYPPTGTGAGPSSAAGRMQRAGIGTGGGSQSTPGCRGTWPLRSVNTFSRAGRDLSQEAALNVNRLPYLKVSAHKQIAGTIKAVNPGATTTHVTIEVSPTVLITASITNEAAEELALKLATAVIKASDVMVGV